MGLGQDYRKKTDIRRKRNEHFLRGDKLNIYTLNVGQGQFVIVTGSREGFIVDTHIPANNDNNEIFVKGALSKALNGINLVGLVVTGFDADHFNKKGLQIILNKYRPNWIMYPTYFHDTQTSKECFEIIDAAKIQRKSTALKNNNERFYTDLSTEFTFEIFSPHSADLGTSNNCSLVVRVHERSTGGTYLITGDTENTRWDTIMRTFGSNLQSHVYSGAHHGSKGAVSQNLMNHVNPHTVLISAGVGNQFGHPHPEAMAIYKSIAHNTLHTNQEGGKSFQTVHDGRNVTSYYFS
jgi:beta-lactamase superfamily II metal-dependent hydrolase